MKKKILSMILSLAIIWVISVPAFATNRNEIRILQDDDNFRIAQSISDDGVKYTATYDKRINTLTFQSESIKDGQTSSVVADMNDDQIFTETGVVNISANLISPTSIASGSKTTTSGFSYNYTSTYCHLSRPQKIENSSVSGTRYTMTTVERPSNHDALISYRAAVNAISVDEKNIQSYTGAKKFSDGVFAVLASVTTTITPAAFGLALGTLFTSMGFALSVQSYTEQLGADMDTALMHYMDIQYDYENYL